MNTTTLKLSEAVRKSVELFPVQCFCAYVEIGDGGQVATDAIGGALLVLTNISPEEAAKDEDFGFVLLPGFYPELPFEVAVEIMERGDKHHETREAIANWLESAGY